MGALAEAQVNEVQIIAECRRNETHAQQALVEEYKDRVYSTALNFFNSSSAAMDITQDVFLKVFEKIGEFRGEASLGTWIYRITVNTCLNEIRRRKRLVSLDLKKHLSWTTRRSDRPDHHYRSNQTASMVRNAIQELDPELRLIIVLRYVEELPYREISAILDYPMGTVASRLNRAHGELGEKLAALRKKGNERS